MKRHLRLTAAVSAAALAASFVGPVVAGASAATRPHVKVSHDTGTNPVTFLIDQVTSEVLFDVSPANLYSILQQTPLGTTYGSLF